VWFLASIVAYAGSDYTVFTAWLRTPFAASAMVLLLIALFHHTALGLQVVIENYVHSGAKFAAVIAIQLCRYGLAVIGFIAVLRVALRN
jgi:succinate dehydrogenase / fumarate reductase membrane anchor subunit